MLGALLMLIASIGLLRLADVYQRSHAAGKAATLGVCLVLLGTAVASGEIGAWARVALAAAFLLATIPVATQLLTRAAFHSGQPPTPDTWLDPEVPPGD